MRYVVVPLLFVLLFAGPGLFDLRFEGRGPSEIQEPTLETWGLRKYCLRVSDGDDFCSLPLLGPRTSVLGPDHLLVFEPRPSALLGGIALAQQTSVELSLNAQLLAGARNGDEALVRRALEGGAAPNSRNRTGDSALMIFIRKGNAPMVDLLLGKGADVNLRNLDKVSPLMTAAYHGYAGIARVLLDRGADVTAEDQIGKTSMVYAAGQGHSEIVGMLLEAGVDVNKLYRHDLTALMWAAGYGKADTVTLLLEKGADPGLKDKRGKTASQIAAEAKHRSVAELLAASEMK